MRFERLSIEDGLSQSVVNCVLQDSTGFLWLGTQAGLNRFDGYGFEVFRHDAGDPASLAHDWILDLAEGPSGDLWIATEGGGLARWHRKTGAFNGFRHDPEDPESLSSDRLVDLAWDRAGKLWIGTFDGGLNRYDPATGRFEHFRHDPAEPGSLADDQVRAVYEDRLGRLWLGTWGGLDLYDPQNRSFSHFRHDPANPGSLSDDRVRAIVEDREGWLWVGTHAGLNRFDGRTASLRTGVVPERQRNKVERFFHDRSDPGSLSHDWVRSLMEDRDGRLWVGTDGGLNLWQETTRTFDRYHPDAADPASLGNAQIVDLYQDRGGILWVGTLGGGVNKWNPGTWSFAHYRNDDEQASNMVFSVSEDRGGALWLGTLGGGLERLDRATGRRDRWTHDPGDPSSLSDDRVTALHHDRQGVLWVGTVSGGLSRFVPGAGLPGHFEHFRHDPRKPDSLSADGVTSLFEDRRSRLWVATLAGGLNLHRGGGVFLRFRHEPAKRTSLGSDRVFALAEDQASMLWLATDGAGLSRLHPATAAFLRVRHVAADAASLASDELLSVHVDSAGCLWAGTKSSGLDRLLELDDATGRAVFQHYSKDQGLPDDTIWGIRSEPGGGLWLATNGGLARLDPESGDVESYTSSHGLQSNEFNMGASFSSSSGELFFGGLKGLNAFFPDRIEAGSTPPPVVLTSFSKTGEAVRFDRPVFDLEEISLGHRDYFFSFEVAALDFTAPRENRYRYKLEGFDADWVDLGRRRQLTFTNLDAGRYTLLLQGSNNDGVWNEEGASVSITVAPPPWETWWAYAFYVLALAAAVAGVVRRQRREVEHERTIARRERAQSQERARLLEERGTLIEELEAKNAELERFNYTVSHDLKSPLVTIKGFLGLLKKDAAAGDVARLEHDARRIGAAADRMSNLLDELLELSTVGRQVKPPEDVALADLAREAAEAVAGAVAARGDLVAIDPGLPVVFGERLRLRQLYHNLLANAVKYMGEESAPRIEVGARRDGGAPEGEGTVLFVRDNGMGIDARYHERVFGLFERLDAADEGTGVGLALAKRIVELHGGRIWVESEGPGKGSAFCFTLPGARGESGGEAAGERGKLVQAGDRFR